MSATPVFTLPDRRADSAVRLHPLLAGRWSPRGFDASYELTDAELTALLEAARWAPSAANAQPWRFLVGRRGAATFDAIVELLMPGNQAWAPRASLLMVAVADTTEAPTAPWAVYDTGQAVAHLSVQAEELGLAVHQMGGFDAAGVSERFGLAAELKPIAAVAVGRLDPAADLPEPFFERERAPRERRPVSELLIAS
ncbi:nitroreductase family protein [Sporichthya sp.]|uniref:nitroreductase family protein n=1 Tax=Sporichthya sp. TaxID=65475 RepID=UPI0017DC3829|nr:nitroreductase family protein [Sporichthya sp.]MBA3743467.1 nitroreductase family protein [Sporichthya sp.]